VRTRDNLVTENKHRTNRGFSARSGLLGFGQRQAHEIFVGLMLRLVPHQYLICFPNIIAN
jgi:hypothetical protein